MGSEAAAVARKMRSCMPEERRVFAMKLAGIGTDEAVQELIYMAEGNRRRFFSRYGMDDQLIAVEALGCSDNRVALDYLSRLAKSNMGESTDISYEDRFLSAPPPREEGTIFKRFPNAKGELKKALEWNVYWEEPETRPKEVTPPERSEKAYFVIKESLEKLEQKLDGPKAQED